MKRLFSFTALLVLTAGFLTAQDRISTADFNKIEVRNAFNVLLVPSDKCEIVIPKDLVLPEGLTADDIISINRGMLTIAIPESFRRDAHRRQQTKRSEPYITIYFKSLESLRLSGASCAKAETPIRASELKLVLSGASDAKLNVVADQITTTVSGASDLTLTGRVNEHKVNVSGASDVKAGNLNANQTVVQLSGASDAKISSQKVTGSASGASTLRVNSNADRNVRTSGASSVKTY
jgi:hypothetical protein